MQHPTQTGRDSRGFTLIELLTVIAIIGILAAIIIPTVSKVRANARNVQCMSQIREWGRIIQLYSNDHKGTYVTKDWASAQSGEGTYRDYFTQSDAQSKQMRTCPCHPSANQNLAQPPLTYVLVRGSVGGNIANPAPDKAVPLGRARTPSQYLLLVDSLDNANADFTGESSTDVDELVIPMFDPASSVLATDALKASAARHGGGKINAVFGDGSLRKISGKRINPGDTSSIQNMRTVWFLLY